MFEGAVDLNEQSRTLLATNPARFATCQQVMEVQRKLAWIY